MITDLAGMMEERLVSYRARSNALPDRILVYRDGVSEVSTFEMPPMGSSLRSRVGPICHGRRRGDAGDQEGIQEVWEREAAVRAQANHCRVRQAASHAFLPDRGA